MFVHEQMAKAAEQEEDSKKKIVALEKEIAKVQENKVTTLRRTQRGWIEWRGFLGLRRS